MFVAVCRCTMFCFYGFFFFKKKTAYEMRISDWSSDVCSSDLAGRPGGRRARHQRPRGPDQRRSRRADPVGQCLGCVDRGNHRGQELYQEIGRAHVRTPVTNAHLVCSLLLEKKKKLITLKPNLKRYSLHNNTTSIHNKPQ